MPVAVRAIRLSAGRDRAFRLSNSVGLGLDINSLFTFDFTQQTGHRAANDSARRLIPRAPVDTRSPKRLSIKVTWQEQNFTATVTWGQIKATPEYLRDCPDKIPPVPTQSYEVNFTFDGSTFQPVMRKPTLDRIQGK